MFKTISDNVLTSYILTIKSNLIDFSFQYTTLWQPVQSLHECVVGQLITALISSVYSNF